MHIENRGGEEIVGLKFFFGEVHELVDAFVIGLLWGSACAQQDHSVGTDKLWLLPQLEQVSFEDFESVLHFLFGRVSLGELFLELLEELLFVLLALLYYLHMDALQKE